MAIDYEQRIAGLERQVAEQRRTIHQQAQALQACHHELSTTLDQQTAISAVLKVISRSAFDLQPVLQAQVESAATLCGADEGYLLRVDGAGFRFVAGWGVDPVSEAYLRAHLLAPGRGSLTGRVALERRPLQVLDLSADPDYQLREQQWVGTPRSSLGVPMLREGELVGVFVLDRRHVEAFTDRQVELVTTFADQAVIAIENTRLFQELQERNRELQAALEQQTAMAEVLKIISHAPTELQPVLDAVAQNAAEFCQATDARIMRVDGERLRPVAAYGTLLTVLRDAQQGLPISRGWVTGRAVVDRQTIHVHDLAAEAEAEYPLGRALQAQNGHRTTLATPLLREGEPIGVILIRRMEVQPFTQQQIHLLETFADQAVIAIENARLFQELQERTQELARSVEELRALGEVGQAVSSSLDVEHVLATVVAHAVQLSGAEYGAIYEFEATGACFHLRTVHTVDEALKRGLLAAGRVTPISAAGTGPVAAAFARRAPVQIPDLAAVPAEVRADDRQLQVPAVRELLLAAGLRAVLAVPLMRDDEVIGTLIVRRRAPSEFAQEVVDLLQTFATQSTLAIQNARLYQQIAQQRRQLAEASQHKSEFLASMSHELRTPLNGILGFSEVLLDPDMPVDDDTRRQFTQNIYDSGRHLLTVINDILDLSKVEAGKLELHPEDFDLADALRGVHSVVKALADRKQQTLTLAVPAEVVTLHHDPGRFKQVLFNLLSNAVKFTPDGGSVTTTATTSGDGWIEVAVQDTGIGIAPEDQGKVFEEFQQIDSGYARTQQGTGLGLALVQSFVRLMGGDITLQSALGEGSTFTVRLPVRQPEPAATAAE